MTRHKVWASRLDISLKNDKCYFFALSLFYCSSSRSRMRSIYIKRQFNSTHMASQFFRRLLLVLLSQTLMAHYSHKCDREGIYTRRISCSAGARQCKFYALKLFDSLKLIQCFVVARKQFWENSAWGGSSQQGARVNCSADGRWQF